MGKIYLKLLTWSVNWLLYW